MFTKFKVLLTLRLRLVAEAPAVASPEIYPATGKPSNPRELLAIKDNCSMDVAVTPVKQTKIASGRHRCIN